MKLDEARSRFAEAQGLYAEQQYAKALQALDALDAHFPASQHIQLAKAYCYAQLFQPIEAIKMCNRILARHENAAAHELKLRLVKNDGIPPIPVLQDLAMIASDPGRSSSAPPRRSTTFWIAVVIGAIAALAAACAVGYYLAAAPGANPSSPSGSA